MSRRKAPAIAADFRDDLLAGADAATALDHHLGGEADAGINRNGYGRKSVITHSGMIGIDVQRDRAG